MWRALLRDGSRRVRIPPALPRLAALLCLATPACLAVAASAPEAAPAALVGARVFSNSRDPPTYESLDAATQARDALGHAVFNTQFVPAGTPGAARIDGLGPLFNSSACDECHNEGADARGPRADGPAPGPLVVQLEPPVRAGRPLSGDPRYGHVLSTAALEGLSPEGAVWIHYEMRTGHYPDGTAYQLRVPTYRLTRLRYGALSPSTVIRPRMAPALFGDGLLEAVPAQAIVQGVRGPDGGAATGEPAWQWVQGQRLLGRFGWQGNSISIRDQIDKAFSREMGLTTRDIPQDDCTSVEADCRAQPSGGQPEVSDELLDGVVQFVRWLAVPAANAAGSAATATATPGAALDATFVALGCEDCHRPRLPVVLTDAHGQPMRESIAAYTDLRVHDLGDGLADRDASGHIVPSRWRTAPLWGMGYRLGRESFPTMLHDGRARSLEEAILWHDGEARHAREGFEQLPASERAALLRWLGTL
ncbi:MAG TPA: di-heme oxidoredictase family protein [Steroidobacteraceae bacterium]|jgi:CxxC motif-containing protein (DUF1111 family)|nr:di-heme oxidoredictase family protein [Steroidobacteraceae bacterium]